LTEQFTPRSDALKADQALARLTALSYQLPGDLGDRLRGEVERLLDAPELQTLAETP
jgi:hypothetical protein